MQFAEIRPDCSARERRAPADGFHMLTITTLAAAWQPHFRHHDAGAARTWQRAPIRTSVVRATHESFDEFEARAFAGIWDAKLDLDDGLQQVAVALDPRGSLTTTSSSARGSSWERWEASADESDSVKLRLRIGPWMLRGTGCRDGLRCRELTGSVLEGGDDPVCVGSFSMTMATPAADDDELTELERSHYARLDAKPAPPPRFRRDSFVGRWSLLVAFEDTAAPSIFPVSLGDDRKFTTPADGAALLGGSWGVWDASMRDDAARRQAADGRGYARLGTHFYMRVERGGFCCGLSLR